ncbi:hypothetical protein [Roseibium sp.]|uniref:hypothetical protein n=1 Tax=Roseibium sp. TaxID=1936156 RepID=UPI003A96B6F2
MKHDENLYLVARMSRWAQKLLPGNPLFRLLAINGAIGVFVSCLFLLAVFALNIGNLRVLVAKADDPVLPVIMLAFGLVITLTSVVMGTAIMMLKSADDGDRGTREKSRLALALSDDAVAHGQLRTAPAVAGRRPQV